MLLAFVFKSNHQSLEFLIDFCLEKLWIIKFLGKSSEVKMITVEKICFLTVTELLPGTTSQLVLPRRSSKSLMAVSQ
jgi:hypothetical protein